MAYNKVKVFSATKARDREVLGEKVTEYLRSNPTEQIVDYQVHQSSDNEFHCVSIVMFFHA